MMGECTIDEIDAWQLDSDATTTKIDRPISGMDRSSKVTTGQAVIS
jgi:hypothetical protein